MSILAVIALALFVVGMGKGVAIRPEPDLVFAYVEA
jgi:hypothetical protein